MDLFSALIFTLCLSQSLAARFTSLCPTLTVVNGRVRYRQRGRIARFTCNTGYLLVGDRYSVCSMMKWDNVASKCVRASCKDAKPPQNGLIYPSFGGAVLNFYCRSGFQLRGSNITYCDGVKWDSSLPACLPSNSTPPLSCDFETENLCGWNHDLNHDFDWTRLNYATPSRSIGTGPDHDHTKGKDKDGYYMYIESSARNINDHARLISPVYNRTNGTTCFEFYYHMFGATTGSLRVYLHKVNAPWALDDHKALFVKNGNQGNRWLRGFVDLGVVETEFQIIIEGVRGSSYYSDIAIDDVRLIPQCDPDNEETTSEEPSTSETPITVESCENRCNTNDSRKFDWLLTCDCDETCYDRERCCADYFDVCVGETTTELDTTEFIGTTGWTQSATPTNIVKVTTTPTTRLTPKPQKKKTTTSSTAPSVEKKTQSKIVYVVPTESDVVELRSTISNDEEKVVVPIRKSDKTYDHQKIIVKHERENNTRTVIFAVGVVFGVLFAMVGMAFVARRYQLCSCKKIGLNHSSNGDSQSDVRFLTGNEILDFSLATDYDTL